jgi:hypothetical protein
MAASKPEGWHLDILTVEPDRLAGGERSLVLTTLFAIVIFVLLVSPRTHGAVQIAVIAGGAVLAIALLAGLRWAWCFDWMLSKTLPRFLRYPAFIPAHATTASKLAARRTERRKRHLTR